VACDVLIHLMPSGRGLYSNDRDQSGDMSFAIFHYNLALMAILRVLKLQLIGIELG